MDLPHCLQERAFESYKFTFRACTSNALGNSGAFSHSIRCACMRIDEACSAAACSYSIDACNGSQLGKTCSTVCEIISTPNPSHAEEEFLFGWDLRGIPIVWETALFPLRPRSLLSPVPTGSGQRLSQSGCFYELSALSLCSSNYTVYFGNKNVLFDNIRQEGSPAFPSAERGIDE